MASSGSNTSSSSIGTSGSSMRRQGTPTGVALAKKRRAAAAAKSTKVCEFYQQAYCLSFLKLLTPYNNNVNKIIFFPIIRFVWSEFWG